MGFDGTAARPEMEMGGRPMGWGLSDPQAAHITQAIQAGTYIETKTSIRFSDDKNRQA